MGLNANTSRVAGDFEVQAIEGKKRCSAQEKSLLVATVSKR
jgi:hypothetical protein